MNYLVARLTLDKFKENYYKRYPNSKYIIPDQKYHNAITKIKVICPTESHGVFYITPNKLYSGEGCSRCSKNYRYNIDDIKKIVDDKTHGRYIIKDNIYINAHEKLTIYDTFNNTIFSVPWNTFYPDFKNPVSDYSESERIVYNILVSNDIDFDTQWKYEYKGHTHFFDFYIPKYNSFIELQGQQHFRPCTFGSTIELAQEEYNNRKEWDKQKQDIAHILGKSIYCIPYTKFNVDSLIYELNKIIPDVDLVKYSNVDYFASTRSMRDVAECAIVKGSSYASQEYKLYKTTVRKYTNVIFNADPSKWFNAIYSNEEIAKYFLNHSCNGRVLEMPRCNINVMTVISIFKKVYGVTKSQYKRNCI